MTHEPECTYDWKSATPYCTCSALRTAYQRGREDAAKAVEDWVNSEEGSDPVWFGLNGAIAAARGNDVCVDIELMHYDEIMNDRW